MTEFVNLDDDSTLQLLDANAVARELHTLTGHDVSKLHGNEEVSTPKPKFMVGGNPYWASDQVHAWQVVEWLMRETAEKDVYSKQQLTEKLLAQAQRYTYRLYSMTKKEATLNCAALDALLTFVDGLDRYGVEESAKTKVRTAIRELDQKGY